MLTLPFWSDLFVFFNTFQHYENINDVELRLAETIRHAAKATFSTLL